MSQLSAASHVEPLNLWTRLEKQKEKKRKDEGVLKQTEETRLEEVSSEG